MLCKERAILVHLMKGYEGMEEELYLFVTSVTGWVNDKIGDQGNGSRRLGF